MDINNLKGLMEAYQQVNAPQEVDEATAMAKRGYDETKLRKRAGGGEAADRATSLENRPTYGDAKKAKQRTDYARKQRGDFRKTASSNPGLHVGQHKSDDPKVKAKQAARGAQRGALTPNERKQLNMGDETFDLFDTIIEFLCVEGYAETMEEAEWIMANELDAEDIDAILEGSYEDRIAANNKKYDANRKRAAQRAAARNAARDAGQTGAVKGVGYVTPRRERETYTDSSGKTRHAKGL